MPGRAAGRRGDGRAVAADRGRCAPRRRGARRERARRRRARAPPPRRAAASREARATTNRVARTFALACRLLPRELREDVYLLYLVFRTLDDLVDDAPPGGRRARRGGRGVGARRRAGERTREVAVLEDARRRATRSRAPRSPTSARACAGTSTARAFASEAELDAYCYRVAGTVGIVMASVLGTDDDARARPAAAALGMAMQRTNILRDLDEDGAAGRAYLARETTDRFGAPRAGRARGAAARPDRPGGRALRRGPRRRRRCCATAARRCAPPAWMYREILRQIERDGYGARAGPGDRAAAAQAVGRRAARRAPAR